MKTRLSAALSAAALGAAAITVPTAVSLAAGATPGANAAAPGQVTVVDACLDSVPEPGTEETVQICYSLFRPATASRNDKVPMIMHSHGWGGSRTKDPEAFSDFLDAGYGVLSFDQRGFGESGGKAHVENPNYEGHDLRRLVRLVGNLRWVEKDGKDDPRMGAIGGSYGGGYQFLAAMEQLRVKGEPIFDALAPEITWYDLNQSLAPEGVVRTEWAAALSAAAVPTDALTPKVYKALAEGVATGMWPDGSIPGTENIQSYFEKNGPRYHVANGRKLNIPVLFGQGTTDSLFPLQQGLTNFKNTITRSARKRSMFVGYNGGHVLPAVLPSGIDVTSDPCSERLGGGDFEQLSIRFFGQVLKGESTGLHGYGKYHLATPDSTCTTVSSVAADKSFDVGTVATSEAGGVPLSYEVAQGPIRIAGTPYLKGTMTAAGANNRAFYGLAVGTSPADAKLVQNNVLPVNELTPVVAQSRRIALPSVAVDVPAGQNLYLLASPFSDTFVGMASRTPGAILLEETVVHLPVVGR